MRQTRRDRSWALVILLVLASSWLAAILLAPWAAADHRSPWLRRSAAAAYLAGRQVCHQRPSRSFHDGDVQLPVCARCTGVYAGAVAGLLLSLARPRRSARTAVNGSSRVRWWGVVVASAAPATITWLAELAGWLPAGTGNPVRAASGLVLGAGGAWMAGVGVRAWLDGGR